MADFAQEYDKLNKNQLKAVEDIDGPLLVIAGPGTGKTQLLSVRIANILKRTDDQPENILCLTFTNKAANNMRGRLSALAGPAGNRVPVRTFHSFAAELMANYSEFFWNGARLTHVPEQVQLEIITAILGELPLDNPLALKFAGAFTAVRDVQEGLKLAKEAGLTPDRLRDLTEANRHYIDAIESELVEICAARLSPKKLDGLAKQVNALPDQNVNHLTRPLISLTTVIKESFDRARAADEGTGKTASLSRWKRRWVTTVNGKKGMFDERKRNAWWLALADVYKLYRDNLHQRGFYDYADMIIEVISQLERHPDMLADVQEQYQYVLIDEFQDTNAAQLRLSHLIADHYSAGGRPNIMAVGDDDQAIYKFNGAELSNMLDFRRSYPSAGIVVLTDNYRSSQAVLDFSDKLIAQAAERLSGKEAEISKLLTARNEPAKKGSIEHLSYPTRLHQYHDLARKIAGAHKHGSVAVLARGHESLRSMAAILREQDTPIRYEQQQNVLEQEAVRQIILIAEVAAATTRGDSGATDEKLAKLLQHPAWDVEAKELWRLAVKNRYGPDWIDSLLHNKQSRLQNIAHWLLWLSRESAVQPLPRMLEYIIGLKASEHMTSPLREYFLRSRTVDTPYVAALSGIHKLLGLTREFCRQGEVTLQDFVRLITVAKDNNQIITDESLFVSAPEAVELLTVHKAKGLEFDSVFIIDAQDGIWRPSARGRKPPANLPLKPSGDDSDDYIRLMFVAVTRARRNVRIGSYHTDDKGAAVLPSGIIRDILPAGKISIDDLADPVEVLESNLAWPRLEGSQEKLLLGKVLENFSLSPTSLLNFLDVTKGGPGYFLERHLLKLPEAASIQIAFGNAMHAALEKAQQLSRDQAFELGKVLSAYETALQEQYLGRADHDRYLLHGQGVIRKLFEEYGLRLERSGQPEVKLAGVQLDQARLHGNLDRVDADKDRVLITDYKTGTPLSSLSTRNKTLQLKAWRHRTQLQFYVLLARESRRFKTVKAYDTQMIYVEGESVKDITLSYTPTREELDRLQSLIAIAWEKITSLNLPDVRHYEPTYEGIKAFERDLLNGTI